MDVFNVFLDSLDKTKLADLGAMLNVSCNGFSNLVNMSNEAPQLLKNRIKTKIKSYKKEIKEIKKQEEYIELKKNREKLFLLQVAIDLYNERNVDTLLEILQLDNCDKKQNGNSINSEGTSIMSEPTKTLQQELKKSEREKRRIKDDYEQKIKKIKKELQKKNGELEESGRKIQDLNIKIENLNIIIIEKENKLKESNYLLEEIQRKSKFDDFFYKDRSLLLVGINGAGLTNLKNQSVSLQYFFDNDFKNNNYTDIWIFNENINDIQRYSISKRIEKLFDRANVKWLDNSILEKLELEVLK